MTDLICSQYEDSLPAGKHNKLVLNDATEDFGPTVITALKPTWRDLWKIIRGHYEPRFTIKRSLTAKGQAKILKSVWTSERLVEQLNQSPLMDRLNPP